MTENGPTLIVSRREMKLARESSDALLVSRNEMQARREDARVLAQRAMLGHKQLAELWGTKLQTVRNYMSRKGLQGPNERQVETLREYVFGVSHE